jgi:alanine racemase
MPTHFGIDQRRHRLSESNSAWVSQQAVSMAGPGGTSRRAETGVGQLRKREIVLGTRQNLLCQSAVPAATLYVDLNALVENWRTLCAQSPSRVPCAAVVKADAYGLGAAHVAPALYGAGCRHFFVAVVDEALALRPSLPADARIFVLHGPLPGAEIECVQHGILPVLNSMPQVRRWQSLARQLGRPLQAGLQVDTGMARLGLSMDDALALDGQALDGIDPVLWMSHLVAAEEPDNPTNALQLARFLKVRERWPQVPASLANSSGVFLGPSHHFDLLRPGAAMYGVAPTVGRPNPMRPVVSLRARMIQWHTVQENEGVGYNHTWVAGRQTRVATVSLGYADGYLRSLSNRAQLRLRGFGVPLIGRVSMDTVTVDVTDVPESLLTPDATFHVLDELQDVNALAAQAGTNAYEILTSLGNRYRRLYLNDNAEDI